MHECMSGCGRASVWMSTNGCECGCVRARVGAGKRAGGQARMSAGEQVCVQARMGAGEHAYRHARVGVRVRV